MIIRKGPMPAGWTALPNAALEDGRLSLKARGLLAYLLSRPENWETDSDRLARSAHALLDGRDSIRAGLRDLVAARYVVRVKTQDARGRWSTATFVYPEPQPEIPPVDNGVDNPVEETGDNSPPTPGYPKVGKPGPINNTKQQEISGLFDTATGGPVDNSAGSGSALGPASGSGNAALASGSGNAALASGSPSAAAPGGAGVGSADDAAELSLDDAERLALEHGGLIAPAVGMFALRAHVRRQWGQDCRMEDALALVQWHSRRHTLREVVPSYGGPLQTRQWPAAELVAMAWKRDWEPPTRIAASGDEAAPRPSRE